MVPNAPLTARSVGERKVVLCSRNQIVYSLFSAMAEGFDDRRARSTLLDLKREASRCNRPLARLLLFAINKP